MHNKNENVIIGLKKYSNIVIKRKKREKESNIEQIAPAGNRTRSSGKTFSAAYH